jgi:hypothetical protein
MGKFLVTVLTYILSSALSKILAGAGIGIASYTGMSILLSTYIFDVTNKISTLGIASDLGHIAGVDTALSIVFGAIATRLSFDSSKLFLKKLS